MRQVSDIRSSGFDARGTVIVAQTERLVVRGFEPDDAPFVLALLNDPDWLRHIGDRGVRDLDGARAYLERVPIASYRARGYGLNCVASRTDGSPLGMCGLVVRESLPEPDLGFAFLPASRGQGYALEAARAVLAHARESLGIARIVAIVSQENPPSRRLLERLGFRREGTIRLPPGDEELLRYVSEA